MKVSSVQVTFVQKVIIIVINNIWSFFFRRAKIKCEKFTSKIKVHLLPLAKSKMQQTERVGNANKTA